jgi:hypothetical protein
MKDDSVKSKIAFLRLAQELGNVSKACEIYGYSRDSYYRLKKLYAHGGEAALVTQARDKPLLRNQVDPTIQHKLLDFTFEHPELGQKKVSEQLTELGFPISPNGVRSVWLRYDLETKAKRITALKVKADRGEVMLSSKQLNAIKILTMGLFNEQGQLSTKMPGDLLIQDCIKFDHFPQLGTIYLNIVIDSYSHFTFAGFSYHNDSESVTEFMSNCVKPYLDEKEITINRILTDRGAEFYNSKQAVAFQQWVDTQQIKHMKIKAYNSSKINGLCFNYYQFILSHFFSYAARLHAINSLDDLERVFQQWLLIDNEQREDTRAYCYGNTHKKTLLEPILNDVLLV